MTEITLKVNGMQCGMCEAHINDAVRRAFRVKKVSSSHSKGQTVIVTEEDIDDNDLRRVIGDSGYEVETVSRAQYEKKGLFGSKKR